jgi:ankyrin repeat protein
MNETRVSRFVCKCNDCRSKWDDNNVEEDVVFLNSITEYYPLFVGQKTPFQIYLINGGLDTNAAKRTRQLLEAGGDIDAKMENGDALLHYFVKTCEVEGLKSVLELKANVHVKNKDGLTPIELVVQEDRWTPCGKEMCDILIRKGSVIPSLPYKYSNESPVIQMIQSIMAQRAFIRVFRRHRKGVLAPDMIRLIASMIF